MGVGPDYIVTDYIEGDTLAELIRRGDRRLRDRRFVRQLLHELVDPDASSGLVPVAEPK